MASFRIRVDLSDFFDDCRKESYIFVKQEWDAIKAIQNHISRLFQLAKPPLLVTGDGVYLPPEESTRILTQSDTIKVCRSSSAQVAISEPVRKFTNRSNSTLLDHCNLPGLFNTNDSPIGPPPGEVLKRSQIGATQLKKSKLSINFDNPLLGKHQAASDDDDEENEEELTPNVSQKKKRKRVRKRKGKANGSTQSTPLANGSGSVQNGSNVTKQAVNGKTSKHTKFADTASESSSESEDTDAGDGDKNGSLNGSIKLRAEKIPPISRIIKGFRSSCPVQLAKDAEVGDSIDIDESVIAGTEEEEPEKIVELSQDVNNKSAHLDTLRKTLASYPALETLPSKNDYIGFRILTMTEQYVPELSEYVIGLVENVDEDTMDLEIVILAGNEELKQHQEGGKFSLPDCNDTLVDMDDNTLHINWVELKDVRLVTL